ncbi:hypothetical protein ACF0H5_000012 [Mactra antiquata]
MVFEATGSSCLLIDGAVARVILDVAWQQECQGCLLSMATLFLRQQQQPSMYSI